MNKEDLVKAIASVVPAVRYDFTKMADNVREVLEKTGVLVFLEQEGFFDEDHPDPSWCMEVLGDKFIRDEYNMSDEDLSKIHEIATNKTISWEAALEYWMEEATRKREPW